MGTENKELEGGGAEKSLLHEFAKQINEILYVHGKNALHLNRDDWLAPFSNNNSRTNWWLYKSIQTYTPSKL